MKLLFVCSGNTCRSPMAEALTRAALAQSDLGDITVASAGTDAFTGEAASAHARSAMQERGLDLGGHRARRLDREAVEEADLILTMTAGHRDRVVRLLPRAIEKTFTLREFASGEKADVSDPFGRSLDTYRKTAEELDAQIGRLVKRLNLNRGQGNQPGGRSTGGLDDDADDALGGMRF